MVSVVAGGKRDGGGTLLTSKAGCLFAATASIISFLHLLNLADYERLVRSADAEASSSSWSPPPLPIPLPAFPGEPDQDASAPLLVDDG